MSEEIIVTKRGTFGRVQVTLPISAIDFGTLTVKQWPKLGVHTKFHKHATTYLLNIPDL